VQAFDKIKMTIREAHLSDSADIARLNVELGYAGDADTIRSRLEQVASRRDQVVFVAVLKERIVGWLEARASVSLETGHRVEIVGLIVETGSRRHGVGRALVQQAERWALAIGSDVIVVRSNIKRVESHDFYHALGFSSAKTQAVYRKILEKLPNKADAHKPSKTHLC
jgi:GNAT superfamily N-acetyltransferase